MHNSTATLIIHDLNFDYSHIFAKAALDVNVSVSIYYQFFCPFRLTGRRKIHQWARTNYPWFLL